jgi:hypothetical protein
MTPISHFIGSFLPLCLLLLIQFPQFNFFIKVDLWIFVCFFIVKGFIRYCYTDGMKISDKILYCHYKFCSLQSFSFWQSLLQDFSCSLVLSIEQSLSKHHFDCLLTTHYSLRQLVVSTEVVLNSLVLLVCSLLFI